MEKLDKEMSQVQEKHQEAESSHGSDLLNLVVANESAKRSIGRQEPAILTNLEPVANTSSKEETVQQQIAKI